MSCFIALLVFVLVMVTVVLVEFVQASSNLGKMLVDKLSDKQ